MNKQITISIGIVFFILTFGIGIAVYRVLQFWIHSPSSLKGTAIRTVFYEVQKNSPPLYLAYELEKLGVVTNAAGFYWYGKLSGKNSKIKAGDYRFTTKMKPKEVMDIILSGVSFGVPFRVPEGLTIRQIGVLLANLRPLTSIEERFVALCMSRKFIGSLGFNKSLSSLEGYLFPDTYFIQRKTTEEEIIRQMVKKFRNVFTPELKSQAGVLGLSEHQVVTLASIVEKETGAPQERPLIASVFHNRLKKRMRLQSDPTVIYGIREFDGDIRRKDLQNKTPYNTYKIYGLPPGPIASPGKEAILAVLFPEQSPYLYFVSHNNGTHEFTVTYEEHKKAVAKYQLDKKARQGKSWRDLPKSQTLDRVTGP